MSKHILDKNIVKLAGKVITDFEFLYEIYNEKFYQVFISIIRPSGQEDIIPVVVSEKITDVELSLKGMNATIKGEYRSYNEHSGTKNKLILNVFANSIVGTDKDVLHENKIEVTGTLVKEPVFRKTPLTNKYITDLHIAINRKYGKSDYIPCIAWSRNAKYTSKFNVGDRISATGRIQSRKYIKKISDTVAETKTAYELSMITVVAENKEV